MKIKIPLYHATSDFFYQKIEKSGMGGDNFIESNKIRELLADFIDKLKKEFSENKTWLHISYSAERMSQQFRNNGVNFQHGQVYLTPSITCAKDYLQNRFGSEILTYLFKCADILEEKYSMEYLFEKSPDLFQIKRNPPKKSFILELTDVDISQVEQERKSEYQIIEFIDEMYERFEMVRNGDIDNQILKGYNLRLISPLKFECVKIIEEKNWF